MSHPVQFLARMLIVLAILLVGCGLLIDDLVVFFQTNLIINTIILVVFMAGLFHAFRITISLIYEVRWMQKMRTRLENPENLDLDNATIGQTKLCMPLAGMLNQQLEEQGRIKLPVNVMRTFVDGVYSRGEEMREIGRYMVGLLVFLGLLGTFWGLLDTLKAVGTLIGDLDVNGEDLSATFKNLQYGMQKPIDGMAVAFGTSLFGLSGSLILGFFQIHAGQALNRFVNQLEEWLSNISHIGPVGSAQSLVQDSFYLESLLEQISQHIHKLNEIILSQNHTQPSSMSQVERLDQLIELQNEHKVYQEHISFSLKEILNTARMTLRPENEISLRRSLDKFEKTIQKWIEVNNLQHKKSTDELNEQFRLLNKTITKALSVKKFD
ncbi:MAG: hypothetical protein AAF403_04550 [Pseudomonadota bacterium]